MKKIAIKVDLILLTNGYNQHKITLFEWYETPILLNKGDLE